ncbi:MAG: SDR family oxidoreductase [Cyclobacteriaceae bacterium]
MKVLVAGAHGNTGQRIISLLAENGMEPYAMIRKEEQKDEMTKLGGKPVVADLEGDLTQAVTGMDAVIFAAGSGGDTGPEKTIEVDQKGAISLINTAKSKGVGHFVMLSSLGAGNPDSGPDKLKHYLEAKQTADNALTSSGMTYTILRPGTLSDDPASGIRAAKSLADQSGTISRQDVAEALVTSLSLECTRNKTLEMQGGNLNVKEALMNACEGVDWKSPAQK